MKDLEYFKKELIKIRDKKEREEKAEIKKSLAFTMDMLIEKSSSGYPVGTIREWKGKKYQKIAPGKWRRKYSSEEKGIRMSTAALKKAIDKCSTSQELLDLVLQNRDRFADDNGRPLPIVKELSEYVSAKNDKLEIAVKKTDKTPKTNMIKKGESEWGTVYEMENGSPLEAARFLLKNKDGLINNAFIGKNRDGSNFKVGLCYGDEKTGLRKIIEKHIIVLKDFESIEEMVTTIQNVLTNGNRKDFNTKAELNNGKYRVILAKDENGEFVITAFNKTVGDKEKERTEAEKELKRKELNLFVPNSFTQEGTPLPATASKKNIAQNNSSVNEKLAKDTCKNIAELKDYASKNYGIDVEQTDKGMDFSKIMESFNEVEKSVKKYPGLEKFIQHLRYSKPGKSWSGLYNLNDKTLYVGNIKEIKESSTIDRPVVRGRSIKSVTNHEIGHAIVDMMCNTESLKKKFSDMTFEDCFYNSKTLKMQNMRRRYGTYENFKKEASVKQDWEKYSRYEVFEIEQKEKISKDITKNIVNRAFEKLGVKGKRKQFNGNATGMYYYEGSFQKEEIDRDPFFSKIADVSRYALTNDNECIAECLADVTENKDNARPLSKAVFEVLQEALNTDVKKSLFVIKKSIFDEIAKEVNRPIPTLQKSLNIDNGRMSYTNFVKSISENFDFETMRKVCII